MGLSIFDERTVLSNRIRFQLADGTGLKALLGAAGTNGDRLDNILLCNSDGIDHIVVFWEVSSAVNYCIGSINVPAGTGHGGAAAVDAIPHLIASGQGGFLQDNLSVLNCSLEVAVVTGEVDVVAMGGYF